MAITLVQAIGAVRSLLNEANAVYWTDAEITFWLQEGTKIISSKAHCVEADDDLTLVTNQLIYTSSDESWIGDCINPYAAIYNDGNNKYKGLQFIHPKQIGNLLTYTPGDPRYFSFHNRSFYIWPLPSASTNDNVVSVLYAKESDDVTLLTDEFQHLAVLWAQIKAYEKDKMHGQSNALKQQFYSELQFESQDKGTRPGEPPRAVKQGALPQGQENVNRR